MTAGPDTARRRWAVALFGLVVACELGYLLAARGLGGQPGLRSQDLFQPSEVFGSLATASLGLVLSWMRPRNPVGWLLSASALSLAACDFGQTYGARALVLPDEHLPLGELALSVSAPLWVGAVFIPASLILVRYPSGRIDGVWPRRFDRAVIAGFALVWTGYATSPQSVTDEVAGHRPPIQLPAVVSGVLLAAGAALLVLGTLLIVGTALRRVRRSAPQERAALLLLLVTATSASVLIFWGLSDVLGSLAYNAVLVAIVVGVLRYQALGIEVVVRRTLLYAMLTGLVLLVFVGLTTGLARLVPTGPTPQIVAAVLIAVGLSPARDRLQGLVDRMMYGERDDPAATLKRLGSSMGAAPSEGLLLAVVANLAEALHLDGARILSPEGVVVAEWGSPTGRGTLPLSFAGEDLGSLHVGSRRGESGPGRADRQLLDTVTPLIAAVVHAVRLTDELRTERNRVVEATQAERRRLRQELHDGLGPSLTGIGLGLEAAQAGPLAQEPRTAELLSRLRAEVASSLEETRRIIDALRPVTLDGVDVVTALRRRTAAAAESGIEIRMEVEAPLPALPPEVETAAFRIADEAVANVVRHSGARLCTVSLRAADTLELRVSDDGVGGAAEREGGVGLESMRERATRLGGRFRVAAGPAGGTTVVAELPLSDVVVESRP